MKKRQRVWYRTIFHHGWLRDVTADLADHTDPAQRDEWASSNLPRFRPLAPIIREGNYNEWEPSSHRNRWVRVRQMRLNTPEKIQRLCHRRQQRRYRRHAKYFTNQ